MHFLQLDASSSGAATDGGGVGPVDRQLDQRKSQASRFISVSRAHPEFASIPLNISTSSAFLAAATNVSMNRSVRPSV